MNQHVKQNKFGHKFPIVCLCFVILTTMAFYWLCFAVNHYYQEDSSLEFYGNEEYADLINEVSVNESIIESKQPQLNSSKLIRSLSQTSASSEELVELQPNVFRLKLFINISWNENLNDVHSKTYKNLELSIQHGIEDLYDKQFLSENKSIGINVDVIERCGFGMLVKMKVFAVEGELEIKELKYIVENGERIAQILMIATEVIDSEESDGN